MARLTLTKTAVEAAEPQVAEATRRRFMGDGKVPYTPPKEPPKF